MTGARKRFAILGALFAVAVALLVVGRTNDTDTIGSRTDRIAGSFKCPTCQGLSVGQSKANTARAIYAEIERQVTAGRTDGEIRTYLVTRFGEQQLLRPETTGIGSIAWMAPVVVVVIAFAALIRTFRRTGTAPREVSDEDREQVAKALKKLHGTGPPQP